MIVINLLSSLPLSFRDSSGSPSVVIRYRLKDDGYLGDKSFENNAFKNRSQLTDLVIAEVITGVEYMKWQII